nr:LolA-related protein [Luteimonas aquatica]
MLTLLAAATPLCAAPRGEQAPPAPASDPGSPVDSDWILRTLARPAPMRANFVEFRDSPLLKAPLRVSGEYQRPDAETMVREVRVPYLETTTIRTGKSGDGEVTIARAGRSPRKFSLARAPEIAGLPASFGAMLSGDHALLERNYRVQVEGTRRRWSMTLVPRQQALASKLREINLYGRGVELRCIETQLAKGKTVHRTLLAGAAREADGLSTGPALANLCHGEAQ